VAGFQCKRCIDGQLFREVATVKEIMISSLDKLEYEDKFVSLFGRLDWRRWSSRRTGSSANITGNLSQSERKVIQVLYPECLCDMGYVSETWATCYGKIGDNGTNDGQVCIVST